MTTTQYAIIAGVLQGAFVGGIVHIIRMIVKYWNEENEYDHNGRT